VGLIARSIEKAGISTLCVSFREEITELSRPPRILSVKSSAGKPLGKPGNKRMQRSIIEAGFSLLQKNIHAVTTVDLTSGTIKFGTI
jgi:D-proline reductase (dithiol) PrdB